MFTPASLIAAATCASAPGVLSMSMTRSTAMRRDASLRRRAAVALVVRGGVPGDHHAIPLLLRASCDSSDESRTGLGLDQHRRPAAGLGRAERQVDASQF